VETCWSIMNQLVVAISVQTALGFTTALQQHFKPSRSTTTITTRQSVF
jgi:hypothetical protein